MRPLTPPVVLLALATAALASCGTAGPRSCPGSSPAGCPDASSGQPACRSSGDCTPPTPACDLGGTNLCVACTAAEPDACAGATPACVGGACRGCAAHAQCADSRTCLPDGSCADRAQVSYVRFGGWGTACTPDQPCGTLADGVAAGRPYVKMQPGTVSADGPTTIDRVTITILADPGARLSRAQPGTILEIGSDGADVSIFDLEITGGTASGPGDSAILVSNGGGRARLSLTRVSIRDSGLLGLSATAGQLTISRGTIARCAGGGILISGARFDITGSLIVDNGGDGTGGRAATTIGGLAISAALPDDRLDLSTIAGNRAAPGLASGASCASVRPVAFSGDIVFGNEPPEVAPGNCLWTYSDLGPSTPPGVVSPPGNLGQDPRFLDPARGDYHLMPDSPARDAADPGGAGGSVAEDVDGDPRPQGPGLDMGADEIPTRGQP